MSIPVTPQSARNRLHAINEQLRTIGHLPEAVAVICREISLLDGFASRGNSAGRGTSDLTSVEAAAAGVEHHVAQLQDIQDLLDSFALSAGLLVKAVRRQVPSAGSVPAIVEKVLCTVGSYHDDWALPRPGDPATCGELIEYYPSGNPRPEYLCVKHRKRMARAMREQEALSLG